MKSVFVTRAYTVRHTVTKAVIPKAEIKILGSTKTQQLATAIDSQIVYVIKEK